MERPRGAVGIIKIVNQRLGHHIRGAQAAGVAGITLYLDRPPHLVRDQNSLRITITHMSSGVDIGQTRHHAFRCAHGRNEAPARRAGVTAGHPATGQRKPQQLEHAPPIQRVGQRGFKLGKMADERPVRHFDGGAWRLPYRWHIEHSVRLRLPR